MRGSAKTDKRTLAWNALFNVLGFFSAVVIAFFISPILIRGLGDERYGIWSLIEATAIYVTLLDLGVGASVVYYIARFSEARDNDHLIRLFNTTLAFFLTIALFAFLCCALVAAIVSRPFNVSSELATETRWLILLLGTNVALGLVANVLTSVLFGLGRFPAKALVDTGTQVINAILVLMVVFNGGGLVELGIVFLVMTGFKALVTYRVVRFYLPELRFSYSAVNMETFREIRGYSTRAFFAKTASRLSYSSDAIVIGAFMAPSHVTYFVIGARLVQYLKTFVRSITQVLTPAVSVLMERGDQQSIQQAFLKGTRYILWVIVPIEIGLLMLGKPFLTLWLGERYAVLSYPALAILAAPLFIYLSQSISGRILFGMGNLQRFTQLVVGEAIINIVLSIILVQWMGIIGVALGTSIPATIQSILLAVFVCRLLKVSLWTYFRSSFLPTILPAIIPATIWYFLGTIAVTSWISLILVGTLGIVGYSIPALLIEFELPKSLRIRGSTVTKAKSESTFRS